MICVTLHKTSAIAGSALVCVAPLSAIPHLSTDYQVVYGNPNASVEVIQYYSFQCGHCHDFFNGEFQRVKERYLDTGMVRWSFHPVPGDMMTLQAMAYIRNFTDVEKMTLLESLMTVDFHLIATASEKLLKRAVVGLGHSPTLLSKIPQSPDHPVVQDAFNYFKSEGSVRAAPTIEIAGRLIDQFPTLELIDREISLCLGLGAVQ